MRKFMITAAAVLALAAPTAALAGGNTGVSTNDNTKDAIGFCVSNGNTVLHEWGTTTGASRSELNKAEGPGAVADMIQWARSVCPGWEAPALPPGQGTK
jgi:hypothetical protein